MHQLRLDERMLLISAEIFAICHLQIAFTLSLTLKTKGILRQTATVRPDALCHLLQKVHTRKTLQSFACKLSLILYLFECHKFKERVG
jgi:hypothetical protein